MVLEVLTELLVDLLAENVGCRLALVNIPAKPPEPGQHRWSLGHTATMVRVHGRASREAHRLVRGTEVVDGTGPMVSISL